MALGSAIFGSLDINDGVSYAVDDETWLALEAVDPSESRFLDMKTTYPAYVGEEIHDRKFQLVVWLLASDAVDRKIAYNALVAASNSLEPISLTWSAGLITKRLFIHNGGFVPDRWFKKATSQVTAADPTPVAV